ncbi:MAG: hypothetical protein AABX89_06420 [Candidatus Thermoplasmatota archaeon]
MMTPRQVRLSLTVHVVASVGWLGAVAAFLVLAVAGLQSADAQAVRGLYVAMDITARWAIVPFAFASLATGIIHSLGTPWGLVRHYWVAAKLAITLVLTVLLLLHLRPIGHLADVVEATTLASGELDGLRLQLVAQAAAALIALVVATMLSIYKPKGLTPRGWRLQQASR